MTVRVLLLGVHPQHLDFCGEHRAPFRRKGSLASGLAFWNLLSLAICSSISEQLSEFTSWFMMILGFIYLEKYLLTILGAAACYILLP